jgi:hypothetical protein
MQTTQGRPSKENPLMLDLAICPFHPPQPHQKRGRPHTPPKLTPVPSLLCLHCLARDRLMLWVPADHPPTPSEHVLSSTERKQIKDTMIHAWEEEMQTSYGAGLLMWHCFCDSKGVSEQERAPACQNLLSAFVAHMATAYAGKTISSYPNSVRAWHLLHSVPWALEKAEMDIMLQATDKLTPTSLRRKKCLPYTPTFISAIGKQLDLEKPLDAAVFPALPPASMPQPGWGSSPCTH